jgi:hypothetical protein
MLQVSCEGAQVKEQEQQQQAAVLGAVSAAQPNRPISNTPDNTRTPQNVQVFSFESGSDDEAAADTAADIAAGGWFRFYNASLDDEPDAPAVEDLVAELVSARAQQLAVTPILFLQLAGLGSLLCRALRSGRMGTA